MSGSYVCVSPETGENVLGSKARHRDRCGQAIVQVVQGALVGQQEGKAVGKACENNDIIEKILK